MFCTIYCTVSTTCVVLSGGVLILNQKGKWNRIFDGFHNGPEISVIILYHSSVLEAPGLTGVLNEFSAPAIESRIHLPDRST